MWDKSNTETFTRAEATALVGKTLNTNAQVKVTITDIACDGPNSYLLVDEKGHYLSKCCNNGLYVILPEFYWSFVDGGMTVYGTQGYPTWEEAYAACEKERARTEKETGEKTHSPVIEEK